MDLFGNRDHEPVFRLYILETLLGGLWDFSFLYFLTLDIAFSWPVELLHFLVWDKTCLASILKALSVLFSSLDYGLCGLWCKIPFCLVWFIAESSVRMGGAASVPGTVPWDMFWQAELTIMLLLLLKTKVACDPTQEVQGYKVGFFASRPPLVCLHGRMCVHTGTHTQGAPP